MRRKINSKFWFSGIWGIPFGILLAHYYGKLLADPVSPFVFHILGHTLKDWGIMLIIIFIPPALFFLANVWRYVAQGERNFDPFHRDHLAPSKEKIEAQNHSVPQAYLSDEPDGLTVGQYRDWIRTRYVRFPFFNSPEHQFIHGAPGVRKTSMLLTALIWNFNFASPDERFHSVLAADVKPELALKSVDVTRSDIRIIDPSSYDGWGFDVWYGLTQDSSDDEVKERAEMISRALIPSLSGDNIHFSANAQKILSGFLMYGFRKGIGFTESITEIIHSSTKNRIAEIVADKDMRANHPKIIGKVKSFDGNDSDEFASIVDTLEMNLGIFDTDTVKYCFDDSPKKTSPIDLVNGISIFVCISDSIIDSYGTIFGLIFETCINHLMGQSEYKLKGRAPTWILCDEAGTIYVPSLLKAIARGRSKHIQVTVVTQDKHMMRNTYGSSVTESIQNNCKTQIVLACSDVPTARDLSARTGEYRETKKTTHQEGYTGVPSGQNVSIDYRPVMSVADINLLEANNQVLLFAREGWFLVDKITYKDIPELEELSERISSKNLNAGYSSFKLEEDDDDRGSSRKDHANSDDYYNYLDWDSMAEDMRQELSRRGVYPDHLVKDEGSGVSWDKFLN